jgi:hypothetical protein
MTASAATLLVAPGGSAYDPARHRQLVREYTTTLKDGLRSVQDLACFTAGMERLTRTVVGGGSISSSLFAGEVLEDVAVEGNRGWGTRRSEFGTEDIGFVQKRGVWYIRLFARRPKGPAASE